MDFAIKVDADPIPHIPENTEIFRAGTVSFGVEFRVLNEDIIVANFGAEKTRELIANPTLTGGKAKAADTTGVSIHVFGEDGREYLRFDCFEEDPHYHYILPDLPYQRVVSYDYVANGDPLTWTMQALRNRLALMLREAGDAKTAERLDGMQVQRALNDVERAARAIVN
jgi:hypothetical protein